MADLTLNISQYSPLQQFTVRPWETFSPDDQLIITDKINLIVQTLNRLGKLSNDVVTDWNKVMTWVSNDGMTAEVDSQLQKWKDDGTLVALINAYTGIGDLTTLQTVAKDTLVNAINENVTHLAEKALQSDLNTTNSNVTANTTTIASNSMKLGDLTQLNTTDKSSVVNALKEIKSQANTNTTAVSNIGNASPKGTYATLTALQTAFPTGATGIYVVTADGNWYYWNGTAWTAGGTYQSTGIAKNGVGYDQLATGSVDENKMKNAVIGKNLFDKSKVTPGYYVSKDNGTLLSSSSYNVSDYIPIQPNIQYHRIESNGQFAFYDINKIYISGGYQTQTFTTPSNAVYLRSSVSNTTGINNEQIELGSVGTSYVPYSYTLPSVQINNANISVGSVYKSNLNFSAAELLVGKNKFNKDTATSGQYVDNVSGNVLSNAAYYVSDWVPVQANTQYTYNTANRVAIYDTNKVFIIGYNGQATFTTPSNAAYIRIAIPNANINTAQVETGATATSYQSYGYSIDKLITTQTPDYFDLMLPNELCIAVGRTIELYNKQVSQCGNINNYHFSWSCDIGSSMKRKWTVTATSAMVGNHTLTLNVYDNNVNLVATGTTTIRIVNVSTPISTPKNALCMGDSLTASKPWLNEWKSLSDSMFGAGKLNFIGTQGTDPYKNEGYSGWATNNFSTNFVSQIILTVSGVTTPPSSKKNYTVPDTQGSYTWNVESYNIVNGSGTITLNINAGITRTPLASGTITATDGAGTGDSTITYSSYVVGKSNPFWNASTSQLDFNNYLTVNSLSRPDIVQIFLGANELGGQIGGYNTVSATVQTTINNMKTIVDKILSQWVGTKIYIVLTPFYADQNGLGLNYGSNNINNELQMHMNVYAMAKMMMAQFNTYNSAVTIVPIAQTMDSDYAYTPVSQTVNPRSAFTELVETGMVHPSNEGYYQMADTMFSHFVGHYLDA